MTIIQPHLERNTDELLRTFDRSQPFRHLVLDNFLEESFCQGLVENFPSFSDSNSVNESGITAGKAVNENLQLIGGQYSELDNLFSSQKFLHFVSDITGVPELIYDPCYYGGGTHENLPGQELDPHIDFNYHPKTGTHRRLNLILYLNQDWQPDWGGSLELHSDPRSGDNTIIEIEPVFNRLVVFETTEYSWHGFRRIEIPGNKQHVSRKSIALYYYTADRPDPETAAEHSTIYVDRPLPKTLKAGEKLTETDYQELQRLLTRRDQHIERLYAEKDKLHRQVTHLSSILEKVKRYAGPLLWIRKLFR